MIRGLGVDIIEVSRIRRTMARHGLRFLERVFTPEEMALAPTAGADPSPFFAGRWAAKEAVSKALGTGIGAACAWTDVCVLRGPAGEPRVELRGDAAATAQRLAIGHMHVSISHVKATACACVVAED